MNLTKKGAQQLFVSRGRTTPGPLLLCCLLPARPVQSAEPALARLQEPLSCRLLSDVCLPWVVGGLFDMALSWEVAAAGLD